MQKFSIGIKNLNNGPASAFRQGINDNFKTIGYGFDDMGFVGRVAASTSFSTAQAAIEEYYRINQLPKTKGDTVIFEPLTGNDETWIYNGTEWTPLVTGAASGLSYVARTGNYEDLVNKPTIAGAPTELPVADSAMGAIGESDNYARSDHSHPDHFHPSQTTPVADGTPTIGILADQFALADHVHPDHYSPAQAADMPLVDGENASLGTKATIFARADHVHPLPPVANTTTNGLMGYEDKNKLNSLNTTTIIRQNVEVTAGGWTDHDWGSGYEGEYILMKQISIPGMTENHYPEVVFNIEQAESGYYAPIVKSSNGYITIYCKNEPEAQGAFYLATVKGTLMI